MFAQPPEHGVALDTASLSHFMPMHLLMDSAGRVLSFGPTLARVLRDDAVLGARFEDLFEVRSPGGAETVHELLKRGGHRFRLVLRDERKTGFRGLGLHLSGDRILLNLSFGIDLITAVRELSLSDADFAATDLAMELLYLAEANAAVTRELQGLNLRLEGARIAAEEEALTDPLTGLRNRRAASLVLDRLCAAQAPFGLLHMDVDFFKAVNDTLGHAAGDAVLQTVGRILSEQLRTEDYAARIGGDEFVILVVGRDDPKSLRAIAERIIGRIKVPIEIDGQHAHVSASIGIARSSDVRVPEPAALLAIADRALYAAKHAGRGRAMYETPSEDPS